MGMVRPMPEGGGMIIMDGDHMGFREQEEPNAITRIFRSIFTREVAPEWWEEEFMGEFNSANAAMMGAQPETETRWSAIIAAILLVAAAIAVPVIIVIHKKKNRLKFDDDDLDDDFED
jgi:hypothetical protein